MARSIDVQRRGRRTVAALVLAVAALSLVASAQNPQLLLVSTAWPPFTNQPGQPRFALDLVEAALGRVNLSSSTAIIDAVEFTSSLLSGRFDGSAAAWKDPERDKVLVFSQPYLENRLILVGRKGSDVSAATLGKLKGRRIAIVEGYSYGDDVEHAGPTFVRSRTEEDSVRLLLTSAVDYTLMDDLVVQYILDNYETEARAKLAVGSKPLVTRPLYLAIRRARPDAESIISRFNAQLRGMIADRTYHRLLHVSWIQADVDGDGIPEYVPLNDKPGPLEPRRAYSLTPPEQPPSPAGNSQKRFYFGGSIYDSWTAVPDSYKVTDTQGRPAPNTTTARIFTFTW